MSTANSCSDWTLWPSPSKKRRWGWVALGLSVLLIGACGADPSTSGMAAETATRRQAYHPVPEDPPPLPPPSGDPGLFGSCVYSQGFWKTHKSEFPTLELTLGRHKYGQTALQALLQTPVGGFADLQLAHQLIAAELNIRKFAPSPGPAVLSDIAAAQLWLTKNEPPPETHLPYRIPVSSDSGKQASDLAQKLEQFNTGGRGTAHCDDDPCKKDPRLCTCTPTTCAELDSSSGSKHCGSSVPDGCGGVLNCGSCPVPQSCGGGGTPGVCGCTAKTCADLGKTCGTHSNGCGGVVTCGPPCPGSGYCGDGTVQYPESCDGGPCCTSDCKLRPSTHVCRPALGDCDVAETCTGTSPLCPSDSVKPKTVECRASQGSCDRREMCAGNSAFCPPDEYQPGGTVCRTSTGSCDEPDECTGLSPHCPADAVKSAMTVCRPAAGECDRDERCDGEKPQCPSDQQAIGKVCRAAAGVCDVEERCEAGSVFCPPDQRLPAATICRASSHGCDAAELCGGMASCPADTGRVDPPVPVSGGTWTPPPGVEDIHPKSCRFRFEGWDWEDLDECMASCAVDIANTTEPWGNELFGWCIRRRTVPIHRGSLSTGSLSGAQYRTDMLRKWASYKCEGSTPVQIYHPGSRVPTPEDPDGDGWYNGGAFSCVHRLQCKRVQVITPLVLSFAASQPVRFLPDDGLACFDLSAGREAFGCRTDWPTAATPWLVLSQHADGIPRDGRDLFTPDRALGPDRAGTSFAGLAALDSSSDGKLDEADADFARLRLWSDGNADRIAQPEELQTLGELGVVEIDLHYELQPRFDGRGNFERERSSFRYRDRLGVLRSGAVIDVYLALRR